jgi:hypothetical protein
LQPVSRRPVAKKFNSAGLREARYITAGLEEASYRMKLKGGLLNVV